MCPTCRVQYYSKNVKIAVPNSLASSLIETVLHKCKFSQYHCNVEMRLDEIVNHEKKCPERTVKCPKISCQEKLQQKTFYEYASVSKCCSDKCFPVDHL